MTKKIHVNVTGSLVEVKGPRFGVSDGEIVEQRFTIASNSFGVDKVEVFAYELTPTSDWEDAFVISFYHKITKETSLVTFMNVPYNWQLNFSGVSDPVMAIISKAFQPIEYANIFNETITI